MMIPLQRSLAGAFALAILFVSAPARADSPVLAGTFRDWKVYTMGTGADRVCYALAQPKASDPKKAKRDPIYFLISTWPGRNERNEPSVVPGYPYKAGSKVQAEVGSDKFEFFTANNGTAGGAWMQDTAEEHRLVDTMKRGAILFVTGTSRRGTQTRDQYSLAGLSAALDKATDACK